MVAIAVGCVCGTLAQGQDFGITHLDADTNGNVALDYESDRHGYFTLFLGETPTNVNTPVATDVGRDGISTIGFLQSGTNATAFFRLLREPLYFGAPSGTATALRSEGARNDSGAAEWTTNRWEEGDPPGGPTLTPQQIAWANRFYMTRVTNYAGPPLPAGLPEVPNDGSPLLRALSVFDLAYQDSFTTTNGFEYMDACRRFATNVASITAHTTNLEPYGLILQASRSMTPKRRVRLLAEVGRVCPSMQELMRAELWRLAVLEREEGGWGYSGMASPTGTDTVRSNVSAMVALSGIVDRSIDTRGHLSYGSEFREIAVAVLWSLDDRVQRKNEAAFIFRLANVAVPRGAICTHILGGNIGGTNFPSLARAEYWFQDPDDIYDINDAWADAWNFVDIDYRLSSLEARVTALEDRVSQLEAWARATDGRLLTLDTSVSNLQARVAALEAWKETVEARLAEIELRLDLIETLGVPYSGVPIPKKDDRDTDGIDDRVERLLIDAFSPVIMIDDDWRPPVSAEWFVQHCYLRGPGEDPDDPSSADLVEWGRRRALWKNDPYKFLPEYERLVQQRGTRNKWRLQFADEAFRTGKSDIGDEMSWERAKREGNVGMYAHVVKGNTNGEYIVQYFMLLTWNETAYSFGIGNHEGDWACATLFIDLHEYAPTNSEEVLLPANQFRAIQSILESPERINRIITTRVCNHGRFIDTRGDKVDTTDTGDERGALRGGIKPRFWMERGTHELWPNSGGRGYSGWPGNNSFNSQVPSAWEYLTPPVNTPPWWNTNSIRLTDEQFKALQNKPLWRDGKFFEAEDFFIGGWRAFFRPAWVLRSEGYRISFDFGPGQDSMAPSEHKVAREHKGVGGAYITRSIPNMGEIGKEFSKSAELVLRYQGLWGGWWSHNESPDGPWKDEMWVDPDPSNTELRKHARLDPVIRRVGNP